MSDNDKELLEDLLIEQQEQKQYIVIHKEVSLYGK